MARQAEVGRARAWAANFPRQDAWVRGQVPTHDDGSDDVTRRIPKVLSLAIALRMVTGSVGPTVRLALALAKRGRCLR